MNTDDKTDPKTAPQPPPPKKTRARRKKAAANKQDKPGKHISTVLAPGDKIYSKRGSLKFIVKKQPSSKSKKCKHSTKKK
ncbi:MAG: hypothetical protein WB421_13905 [Terriglobales bacterium]